MKLGVTLSASLHTVLLGLALVSMPAPAPITLQEQGIEVDLASLSEAEAGRGETKAELDPKPVPAPTRKPDAVPEARNVGDANEDSPSRRGEITDKPLDTEKASPAPKADKVVAAPEVKPDPVVTPEKAETPVPTTELARLNEPAVPIREEPAEEPKAEPIDPDQPTDQPTAIPVPARAPANRPKPNAAETKQRKQPEEQKQQRTATSNEDRKQLTDQISDLLNTQENTEGGAKRNQEVASLGAAETRTGAKLTAGEYDALKSRVSQCWFLPNTVGDTENLQIVLFMRMARDGVVDEIVSIEVSGIADSRAVRTIQSSLKRSLRPGACNFADVLPSGKFDIWREVRVNFRPQS